MKKIAIFYILALSIISTFSNAMNIFSPSIQINSKLNYTGTYQYSSEGITLFLSLNQDQENKLIGTLKSSNSSQFNLEGMVSEGVASGVCYNNDISLFFEAYLDGASLTLSLIEPNQYNMPDYNTAKYIPFEKVNDQNAGGSVSSGEKQSAQNILGIKQNENNPSSNKSSQNKQLRGEIVKDEINGFQFSKPNGWIHNQVDGQILLGSNTVPGLISVMPHMAQSYSDMRNEMLQGVQEEGIYLVPQGNLEEKGNNIISGIYSGIVQGETAKGYGIGVLSPQSGGIFILAVSTPEKLGQQIMAAADHISMNINFTKPSSGDANLVRHFSGEWAWSNGYRTSWMIFYPNGSYSDQYEAAYSGNFNDEYGNVTGNWGATNQDKNRGRWSIQGNKDRGIIQVIYPNGNREQFEYNVFVERGQKYYREYIINGYHYSKNKDY